MNLKNKNVLFAAWGCENPEDTYMHQMYYLILKKIFPKLKTFDTKKNYFHFGKAEMNKNLLDSINKQKPELIIFALNRDEINLETLDKVKQKIPESKLAIIICDDDARFDNWSRYYALFFDAVIASPSSQAYSNEYAKDGIKNLFYHWDYNTHKLEPLDTGKKYDLTFIGRPKADRNELFKYLMENGVNITLFGWGWEDYPEFREFHKGALDPGDYAKVINQSKINLSPTKAGYHDEKERFNFKGRYLEVALCNSFQLIEDSFHVRAFFNKNEVGLFTTRKDLIRKIKYYLKNEKQREKMASRAYKKVIAKFNREKQLKEIFNGILKIKTSFKEKKLNKKITILRKKDFSISLGELNKKLNEVDYIGFDIGENKRSRFKDYLQIISLERTNKQISCCDYYASFFGLGEHMLFQSKVSFERVGKKINKLTSLNQIVVKKEFFLENFLEFKKLSNEECINLININNTAFVSIPLVTIKNTQAIDYENMMKAFYMRFQDELLAIIYQKKFYRPYTYKILFSSLLGKKFVLRYIFESFFKESNWGKLRVNKSYFKDF